MTTVKSAYRSLQIVQAVAGRPERGPAVGRNVAAQEIGEWAGVGRIGPLRAVGIVGTVGIRKLPAMIQWISGFCDSNPDSNALGVVGILLESVRAVLAAIMRGLAVNYLVSNYSNAIWRLRPAGAFRNGRVGVRPLPRPPCFRSPAFSIL